jgi:hypothetical protein
MGWGGKSERFRGIMIEEHDHHNLKKKKKEKNNKSRF